MIPTLNLSPSLFSVDGLAGVIFLVMIALTVIGGLIACNSERLVRAVSGLIVSFRKPGPSVRIPPVFSNIHCATAPNE